MDFQVLSKKSETGCVIGIASKGDLGGHPQEDFQELSPISCYLKHSMIVFIAFSKALLKDRQGPLYSLSFQDRYTFRLSCYKP